MDVKCFKNQMRKSDRLYHKAKSSKSPAHWQNYKNKRNEIVDIVRSAKSEYTKKLQSSLNDPKLPQENDTGLRMRSQN